MQTVEEKKEYFRKYKEANREKISIKTKKYYKINKGKLLAQNKEYRKNNKEKIAIQKRKYEKANREKISISGKKYRKINKEKIIANAKKYREINKEEIAFYQKYKRNKEKKLTYRQDNKEKAKKQREAFVKANPKIIKANNKRDNDKRKLKFGFRLNSIMSNGIRHSLKNGNGKNGYHWEDLLSYTLNDLIKRLKKTLPAGYTWDDYINGKTDLQIDHKIPVSVHNFKSYTDTDFQRCWALKNLRLLPAFENISKGAKLKKHFQPSLLL